jgi:hypothetical protein
VQLSADDQQLLLLIYSLSFGVDRCGNSGVVEVADGVVEIGITDAILQV